MAKGKNYEREISKDMSLWLTNGDDPDAIWYTKLSGGRATRRSKQDEYSKRYDFGDLGPDDPKVNFFFDIFNCELKTGYGRKGKKQNTLWSILDLIDSKQSNPVFYDFWSQCVYDSKESNREPLLIFRRNRRDSCIAMFSHIFNCFISCEDTFPIEFDTISINSFIYDNPITICNIRHFFDYTWGKINESFIKLRMTRTIFQYERGIINEK